MAAIDTLEALQQLYKPAQGRALAKQMAALDKHARQFIGLSPFALISTAGADGGCDVSPKGDGPGFVAVLDDATLAIPDRPGNNRMDSYRNILENPHVGMLFLIPGVAETLRVNGSAEIRDDPDLLARFTVRGRLPATVLLVHVSEVFLHCAKCVMRSKLWDPDAQIARGLLPSMTEMINDQTGRADPVLSEERVWAGYQKVLY